ncbi:aminoglycoside phosphotransferase family protein [Streptomyces sp. RB6PN25]|uniref:Aminoglycoside phosphotransferase family protein n=1 Tax=Streptomyces humicola TaxID=2953240 RepID=A0ABT1PQL6_9ACTN|nr:phosphotransferase [Streptomyces humicola]MCQ4079967.1 aminoglycoside phosphotransferase family protein [Streptomyces humicola]
MTTTTAAVACRLGADRVEGPLKGHHHEAYAVRLDPGSELGRRFSWLKLREPRPGIFWYDLRCFSSDEELLADLQGKVPRIPEVVPVDGRMSVHSFIEGETLGTLTGPDRPIAEHHLSQLAELFGSLARIDVSGLRQERAPGHEEHMSLVHSDDSSGFLARLVDHTAGEVYEPHRTEFEALFKAVGVPDEALRVVAKELPELTPRPYRLLHGDLHRENLIVDRAGDLWTIDWELARIGDPVYDLATHLHLMRYPPDQEERMTELWREAVAAALPPAVAGAAEDLPYYLAYKRVQSVYTDIMRGAVGLAETGGPDGSGGSDRTDDARTWRVANGIHDALIRAREPLRLPGVAPADQIAQALTSWLHDRKGPSRARVS